MDKLFSLDCVSDFEQILDVVMYNLTYKNERRIHNTKSGLEQNELYSVEDDMRKIMSKSNFNVDQIERSMSANNWDTKRIKYFLNIFSKEKTGIMYAFFNHHNSKFGETIINSDWILKFVFGTSELNTSKYTLLQLILSTVDSNGKQKRKMFELNKDMLLKTIETLEKGISEPSTRLLHPYHNTI